MESGLDFLLAIDLGLKTGLACFDSDGLLLGLRSRNLGTRTRLKRATRSLVQDWPEPTVIYAEGDRSLARIWQSRFKTAEFHLVAAEDWRPAFFAPRQRRGGGQAKRNALVLAHKYLSSCGHPPSTTPTDDSAEALLLGLWALAECGWLEGLPDL